MLDKCTGLYATRPSQGPHKLRESIPLSIVLQNKLKYALVAREVKMICNDKDGQVSIDNKIKRDYAYPCGLMDVISLQKSGENFRVLYDVKGRFILKSLKPEEAKFKLCKVVQKKVGPNKIPYVVTHDGRTLRYPHPEIQVHDTLKYDLVNNQIASHLKFEVGQLVYCVAGNNIGRIGTLSGRDRHLGSYDIVHVKDARGKLFSTRLGNIMVIGKKQTAEISLPKDKGIYLTPLEKREEQSNAQKKKKAKKSM